MLISLVTIKELLKVSEYFNDNQETEGFAIVEISSLMYKFIVKVPISQYRHIFC